MCSGNEVPKSDTDNAEFKEGRKFCEVCELPLAEGDVGLPGDCGVQGRAALRRGTLWSRRGHCGQAVQGHNVQHRGDAGIRGLDE